MELSQQFKDHWRSGKHVGANRPVQFGRIRRGAFLKHHREFTFLDGSREDFAQIPKQKGNKAYAAKWVPHSDWMALPNIADVSIQQSFENNGVRTATVVIDNIVWKALAGVVGTYHLARRGYLSPLRRYTGPGRPKTTWAEINEWTRLFESSSQVDIFQGYGTATPRTFTGLIDQVDMSSNPDTITMTLRGFAGPMLTDQRMFGRNKDPRLRVPITFADRLWADDEKKVSGGAKARSHHRTHPARNITKADDTAWVSQGHDNPDGYEWCQITLTAGRFETFYLFPQYANMEAYVSVHVQNRRDARKHWSAHGSPPPTPAKKAQVDDHDVNQGWYDPVTDGSWSDLTDAEKAARISSGDHMVPGLDLPYIRHFKRLDNSGAHHKLGAKLEVGAGTKLRITFRRLHHSSKYGDFRAGAKRLIAYSRKRKAEAKKNNWILVDDASDVVKVILRWAGYREWEVEDFGWRIEKDKPWVFHQSDYFMDVINYVKSQGNFVFFEKPPTTHDESLGVPVFRHARALLPPGRESVRITDRDLLTGINVSLNIVGRPSIVHVRGREAKKGHGRRLGEERTKRVWAKYIPPWGTKRRTRARQANILRHHTHFDPNLTSNAECKVMAVLIAIQYQLQSFSAHVEIPGFPGIELDEQASVVDEGTGTNTRIWAADIQSQFTSGENAKWTTTIGGALIDTEDMVLLGKALNNATAAALKKHEGAKVWRPGHFTVTDEGDGGKTYRPSRNPSVTDLNA